MLSRQVKSEAYTGNMNTNPPRIRVRMKERFKDGPTDVFARHYDRALFEPKGTADVSVEVAPEVWRIRRVGLLRNKETGKWWACAHNLLSPVMKPLEPTAALSTVRPAATPPAPVPPRPPVPRPDESFLDKHGVFKKG